jgi:hypothetical protein
MRYRNYSSTEEMSPGVRFFFSYIFPYIFLIVGLATLYFGINGVLNAKKSLNWPVAEGIIKRSSVEYHKDSDGDGTYHAEINYEYAVNDVLFNGKKVAYGDYGSGNPGHATEIVNKYPVGKYVNIYYMPEKPDECLLEPGIQLQSFFIPVFGLIFSLVGCVMAVGLPKTLKGRTNQPFNPRNLKNTPYR